MRIQINTAYRERGGGERWRYKRWGGKGKGGDKMRREGGEVRKASVCQAHEGEYSLISCLLWVNY